MSKHNRERRQIRLRMKLEGKTARDLTLYGRARIGAHGKRICLKLKKLGLAK